MHAPLAPFGSRNEMPAPGAMPAAASSPPKARHVSRRSPNVMTCPDSGAQRNGAFGWASACASMIARSVRTVTADAMLRGNERTCPSREPVPSSIRAEQLVLARLAHTRRREGAHHAGDVQEMAIVQVVRDAVASPRAATHRQRERQRIVEAAAGREAMR